MNDKLHDIWLGRSSDGVLYFSNHWKWSNINENMLKTYLKISHTITILKYMGLNKNPRTVIQISPRFVPKDPTDSYWAFVQVMAWCHQAWWLKQWNDNALMVLAVLILSLISLWTGYHAIKGELMRTIILTGRHKISILLTGCHKCMSTRGWITQINTEIHLVPLRLTQLSEIGQYKNDYIPEFSVGSD